MPNDDFDIRDLSDEEWEYIADRWARYEYRRSPWVALALAGLVGAGLLAGLLLGAGWGLP